MLHPSMQNYHAAEVKINQLYCSCMEEHRLSQPVEFGLDDMGGTWVQIIAWKLFGLMGNRHLDTLKLKTQELMQVTIELTMMKSMPLHLMKR